MLDSLTEHVDMWRDSIGVIQRVIGLAASNFSIVSYNINSDVCQMHYYLLCVENTK